MFALAVVLAVAAAMLIAFGVALQEHAAVSVVPRRRRSLSFFVELIRDTHWVAGAVLSAAGVAVHVIALTKGPVAAIQPVGTVGLLFAVGIKAAMDRTRLESLAICGCVAVIAGLAVVLTLLPHGVLPTTLNLAEAVLAGACALAFTGIALMLPDHALRTDVKAGAVALGAGMCFGVAAAVVSVLGRNVAANLTAVFSWPTLLVVVLLTCGGAAQQLAYRMARFAVVYAVLLTADPISAGFAGVLVLGEPMPSTPARLAGLALAAFAAFAGIVALAHARAANHTTPQEVGLAHSDRH